MLQWLFEENTHDLQQLMSASSSQTLLWRPSTTKLVWPRAFLETVASCAQKDSNSISDDVFPVFPHHIQVLPDHDMSDLATVRRVLSKRAGDASERVHAFVKLPRFFAQHNIPTSVALILRPFCAIGSPMDPHSQLFLVLRYASDKPAVVVSRETHIELLEAIIRADFLGVENRPFPAQGFTVALGQQLRYVV